MSNQEPLSANVPIYIPNDVPLLDKNLPNDSIIILIEKTPNGKKIKVKAKTSLGGIIHTGFLNIPDKYYVEIFHPENENVVVLFWYDERNIIFIDNYDFCESSLRVSSG